ncbi:MAG: formylglycine-generating enzyme family protein [Acidimicrobiales bacterium]
MHQPSPGPPPVPEPTPTRQPTAAPQTSARTDPTGDTGPDAPPAVAPEPEAELARSGLALRLAGPAVAALCRVDAATLIEHLGDDQRPFAERLAAGTMLALIGDPRLATRQPDLVELPAATVTVGLDPHEVAAVVARWSHVGVREDWLRKETPRHQVTIHAFRVSRYPVTNGEYLDHVLAVPEAVRPSCWPQGSFPWALSNHPVFSLPPEAADGYAAWLAEVTGRRFRLPTEAEWEYAATGGDGREFPWGDQWDPQRANTAEAGPLCSTPVGMYPSGRSPFGLLDLAGNVEEYVADHYRPYPGAVAVHDDLVDVHGARYRVARGGSYARHGDLARCARRHGWYPSDHYAMGFRLAESIEA